MDNSRLRAGVAREVISPPKGTYLIGYGDRTRGNAGVHDDLTATALVLDDGQERLALVACDLLCLNEFVGDRVRAQVGEGTHVLICCSHTHAGPIAYADHSSTRARRAYIGTLVDRIARAVQRAGSALVPVELAWCQAEADIAVNRREMQPDGEVVIGVNPQGPIDRSVGVLSVRAADSMGAADSGRAADGAPMATVVNFACHGTVLGPKNLFVSADWIGAMRPRVERALGGLTLFLQGAAGDLNPAHEWGEGDPWEAVQRLGERVADRVIAAHGGGLRPLAGVPLRLSRQEVWLPLEARAITPTPLPTYRRVLTKMIGLPYALRFIVDIILEHRYPWRSRVEARDGTWHVPMRVNAARIGDLGLITFAAETLTEIGMEIKAASPAAVTMFASVSDGCIGYLPTAAAHAQGGYEVDMAPYFYRYPARLTTNCDQIAVEAAGRALQGLWERSAPSPQPSPS
jgi:neutral ceramidase